MNIYEYAMDFEKDSENYYRDIAQQVTEPGLKKIFIMLAEEEVKHFNRLKQLSESIDPGQIEDSQILINAVSIFNEIKDLKKKVDLTGTQVDMYRKAQEFEKNSENFYLEKMKESSNEKEIAVLKVLADQENKHFLLLENIIEFVSRPDEWIENAEFNHMMDY